MLLQIIDNRWREHLLDMDYLREGIHLRGFAQIDPLVAYKNEGFTMFDDAHELDLGGVRAATSSTSRWRSSRPQAQERIRAVSVQAGGVDYSGGDPEQPSALGQRCGRDAAAADAAAERGWRATAQPGNGGAALPETRRRHGREGEDRPQRPLLVRLGQEVQEVPRRLNGAVDGFAINPHLLGLRPAGIRGYDANHMATLVR